MSKPQSAMYDVAVVGAGLIGAACAKYLSAKGLRVALLGRTEAQSALGACYDEGRSLEVFSSKKGFQWLKLKDIVIVFCLAWVVFILLVSLFLL